MAIYYSVAGLMTIFAAAAIPIMIMGGVLEVGKLVTAVWLHRYWREAAWWLKTYLVTAVIVLMFITSMGIFGFLSSAHIEQTASAQDSVAQIERIDSEIERREEIVARAEQRIVELESGGSSVTNQLQQQIDLEQDRIETAYDRIQPAIDEQNRIIAQQTQLLAQELQKIDDELALLQTYIDSGDIRRAQQMVGSRADGAFGPATAAAFQAFQDRKAVERSEWLERIQQAQQNDVVLAAREEIRRLRSVADEQIAQSNALINSLRSQLQNNDANSLQSLLEEQNQRILTAQSEIDVFMDTKFALEAEYRKLEAEVGPVKYIAEFVYGEDTDKNILEEAVRWVIVIIIFVFDPLAVLLLIASQFTFEHHRKLRNEKKIDEQVAKEDPKEELAKKEAEIIAKIQSQQDTVIEPQPATEIQAREIAESYDVPQPIEKKDIELSEESKRLTEEELDELDKDVHWQEAKRLWKEDHPEETLKEHKRMYLAGEIDHLPWEGYLSDSKKKNYLMKQQGNQILKQAD